VSTLCAHARRLAKYFVQETGVKGSRCVNDDIGRGND